MTSLEMRKKTLLLESDLNRLTLHAQCAQLRGAKGRLKAAPWALALAPLAGLAVAWRFRRTSPGAGFLAKTLALSPSLIQLWRTWVSPPDKSK